MSEATLHKSKNFSRFLMVFHIDNDHKETSYHKSETEIFSHQLSMKNRKIIIYYRNHCQANITSLITRDVYIRLTGLGVHYSVLYS